MFLVGFANLPEYGNGAVLAPDADPADGQLDVILAEAGSPWRQIWRARRLFWRHRAPADGITRLRTSEATVTGARLLAHLDGEVREIASPARVRVAAAALRVRVPRRRD
jgi:diacylglycerol kinase family enzyme